MEIAVRMILIGAGIGILLLILTALAKRKVAEPLCLGWGLLALLLILAGIVLHPGRWNEYLNVGGLALTVLAGGCVFALAYGVSAAVSEQLMGMRETAMQISLLRFENELEASEGPERPRRELLVIIPAYNEEENIPELFRQLDRAGIREFADVLVIDDGSADGTCRRVRELGGQCVSCIFHQGYGGALQTGYKYAVQKGYSYVVQADADGQHDMCNIAPLYRALRERDGSGRRPDLVLGSRFLPGSSSFPVSAVKMLVIRMFRLILRAAAGQRITDPTSGLQGLNARVLSFYSGYGCFDQEYPDANIIMQMLMLGYQIREIPAVMHPRRAGKSMHSGLRPLVYLYRMIFSMCAVYIRMRGRRESGDASVEQDF